MECYRGVKSHSNLKRTCPTGGNVKRRQQYVCLFWFRSASYDDVDRRRHNMFF